MDQQAIEAAAQAAQQGGNVYLYFIGLLVAALGAMWAVFKMMLDNNNRINAENIVYLKKQIEDKDKLIVDLNKKNFEIATTLHPAMNMTNKTLDGVNQIMQEHNRLIQELLRNGK